jgi:hypothetical protein
MLFEGKKIYLLMMLFTALLGYGIIYVSGCSSDTTTPITPATDTSVAVYDTLNVETQSNNGVNLYLGKVTLPADTKKDISITFDGLTTYNIQSGAMSGGEKTVMNVVDSMSRSTFDALVFVPAWGSQGAAISTSLFTLVQTGNFTADRVFGFYLQGKFDNGETPNKVFGIIHINSLAPVTGAVNISVKINKAGLNKFTK